VTRDECVTFVLDRLQIPSSDTAKVAQTQNILQLEVYRANDFFELTLTSAVITINTSGGVTSWPTDVQKIKAINQSTVVIEMVDETTFAMRLAALAAGGAVPSNPPTFAVWHPPSTFISAPAPSANVSALMTYVQRPAAMSASTVVPLPLEWHDLVCERTVRRMALTEGEPAIAQIALDIARELEQELMGLRNQMTGPSTWQIPLSGYPQ
jgi:hypothetical protein